MEARSWSTRPEGLAVAAWAATPLTRAQNAGDMEKAQEELAENRDRQRPAVMSKWTWTDINAVQALRIKSEVVDPEDVECWQTC